MSRRLLIGLAPLLAIAAFAVMPVAAQAVVKHWYQNGVIVPAGEVVPVDMWGNELNVNGTYPPPLGEGNCRSVGGGTIENPLGGPGIGSIAMYTFYECKAPLCEAEILRIFGVEGRGKVTAMNLPASVNTINPKDESVGGWKTELEEETLKIGIPFVKLEEKSPPGMIRVGVDCEIAATKEIKAGPFIFEGELKPEIGAAKKANLNGTSAGVPSQFKFEGPASGMLHSAAGLATYVGNMKYFGYNHQEVITVKP